MFASVSRTMTSADRNEVPLPPHHRLHHRRRRYGRPMNADLSPFPHLLRSSHSLLAFVLGVSQTAVVGDSRAHKRQTRSQQYIEYLHILYSEIGYTNAQIENFPFFFLCLSLDIDSFRPFPSFFLSFSEENQIKGIMLTQILECAIRIQYNILL